MIHRIRPFPWVILILLVSWAFPVLADEVHLANGDRLSGQIVKMEKGILLLPDGFAGVRSDLKLHQLAHLFSIK